MTNLANTDALPFGLPVHGRPTRWNHLELLELIDSTGSMNKAAAEMGMSYKAAWTAIESINNLARHPMVARQAGGNKGGGTVLTDYGRRFLHVYRMLEVEQKQFFQMLETQIEDFSQYQSLIRRFTMQTSARNQFLGRITAIKPGAVNAEIRLDIGGQDQIVAMITHESLESMNLVVGQEAYALFKAPWVILTRELNMKSSARNQLIGDVARVTEGAVNSEVVVELAGGKLLSAVVTNESLAEMALTAGMKVCALIKASHVILAVAT